MLGVEEDAGIPQVASRPKPRAVRKTRDAKEDPGAGDEELEDANPFGKLYAK
jgi:hypothetical protein